MTQGFDRRKFMQSGAAAFGAAALSGPLAFLRTKQLQAAMESGGPCGTRGPSPYGPLAPAFDQATGLPLIMLPAGFSYTTFRSVELRAFLGFFDQAHVWSSNK